MKVVKEFDIRKQKGESYDIRIILTESQEEVKRIFRVVISPAPSSYKALIRRLLRCRVRAADSTCGCTRLQRWIRRRIRANPIVIVNSSEDS